MDTAGDLAVADYRFFLGSGGPIPSAIESASFESYGHAVPEPWALAQVLIGAVVLAAFVAIRTYRAGKARARATAAGVPLDAQSVEPNAPAAGGLGVSTC